MPTVKRVEVLNCSVDSVDMAGALSFVGEVIETGQRQQYILAMNPEKVITLSNNPALKQIFDNASLLIPDGIGLVLAVRALHGVQISRVAGADLAERICALAAKKNWSVFLFGAAEKVNKQASEMLQSKYPGLIVAGRRNGYVTEEDMPQVVKEINAASPHILFIAMGSPKQEKWLQRHISELDVSICQCIGGTLDAITGNVKRAPDIYQRHGLEWMYRLLKEPRRIVRQKALPLFSIKIVREIAKRKIGI